MPNVLRLSTEERRVREAISLVSDELQLTEQELEETIPSGSETLVSSRVQWSLTYLVQAGLISRPRRAHFIITEEGRSVLENDLDRLNLTYLKTVPAFIEFLSRKGTRKGGSPKSAATVTSDSDRSPEELIGVAYEEVEAELREQGDRQAKALWRMDGGRCYAAGAA